MENKVKVWIARDESGYAFAHFEKHYKSTEKGLGEWVSHGSKAFSKEFPSVKWEDDEPTEAYITLAEQQEQSQPKIDWEQRRYEIAKEMMPVLYRRGIEAMMYGLWLRKVIVDGAVNFADMLIEKLKKGE